MSLNLAKQYVEKFDATLAKVQAAVSDGLKACDVGIAKLERRETFRCARCGIEVDVSKIDLPGRCHDQCPLKRKT